MIRGRYLLLISIPLRKGEDGIYYADELWHRDVMGHLAHHEELIVACPCSQDVHAEWRLEAGSLIISDLPYARSVVQAVLSLPRTVWRIWRYVGRSDIVQAHIVGWPIPTAWVALPIAKLRRRFLVINVESLPWPEKPAADSGIKSWVQNRVYEYAAKACVRLCDLPLFTHEGYRQRLLGDKRGHVIHASWIDREWVLTDSDAKAIWDRKLADTRRPLRLVYVGRLIEAKGVRFLLELMSEMVNMGPSVELDVYGVGPLESLVVQSKGAVRAMGTVPYDARFRSVLQQYDLMVIPTLSDEQPRVVFDAFAQALPCLASDTNGHRAVISHGENGWLAAAADIQAWIAALAHASENRSILASLAMAGLAVARSATHQAMHAKREQVINDSLGSARRYGERSEKVAEVP